MAEKYCDIHAGTKLICPKCIAAKGGKARAKKHTRKELKKWGEMGGAPPGPRKKRVT